MTPKLLYFMLYAMTQETKKEFEFLEWTWKIVIKTCLTGEKKRLLILNWHRTNLDTGEVKERLTQFVYQIKEDYLDMVDIQSDTREKKTINQINAFILWYELIEETEGEIKEIKKEPEQWLEKPILYFKK